MFHYSLKDTLILVFNLRVCSFVNFLIFIAFRVIVLKAFTSALFL